MTIKLILLVALAAAAAYALRGGTGSAHLALRRLAGAGVVLLSAVSVVLPDLVTAAANAVGVGRGADLVLYVFVVASLFVWVALHRRVHDLETRLLAVSRRVAIQEADAQPVPLDLDVDNTSQETPVGDRR